MSKIWDALMFWGLASIVAGMATMTYVFYKIIVYGVFCGKEANPFIAGFEIVSMVVGVITAIIIITKKIFEYR